MSVSRAAEPIAVIGLGCRFPGGVTNPAEFWNFLAAGGDGIVDVPPERWDVRRFYSQDAGAAGKMYVRQGGFLREHIDRFDPLFFGISPREAPYIDPQQRLLLEVTWEALEDGGVVPTKLAGTATGVYIGGFAMDSMVLQLSPLNRSNIRSHYTATAASMTMLAARISYTLDLRGPCISIDTACSSSLVALHYACQGIWNGECSLALAGGVNIMICPQFPMVMCKGHFLSPDSHCKSFDERADGYARGEGCGVIVLKPADDALRDGDRIYAVVCGTGVNQDGHTDGISVPNPEAQEALIRRVYAEADISLDRVRYVEAHGTGTPVGDPIEASVLGKTVGHQRLGARACIVGSVKANIGHLEAAAGIAGVIKTCLCLTHRQIPPQPTLVKPNPNIPFDELGLRLPQHVEPMPDGAGPAYAGVNSFGYGGTNAHVILRDAPIAQARSDVPVAKPRRPYVLPISAKSDEGLRALAQSYVAALSDSNHGTAGDLCYSAANRRAHFDCRLAVVAETSDGLLKQLQAHVRGDCGEEISTARISGRAAKPVFVFSGMGPQWWAMGRELLDAEPLFRKTAEDCDRLFQTVSGWSILAEMCETESRSRMHQTQVAQPASFLLQVALSALWRTWGIEPAACVGHSVGEVAAAFVAGALDFEDAMRVIYHRSRLQQTTAGMGKMLAVGLPPADVQMLIAERKDQVSIAAINSPSALTLSGQTAVLEDIAAQLPPSVFRRMLQVEVPYHSPVMERLQNDLEMSLSDLHPSPPDVPLYSTVTGDLAGHEQRHGAGYWYRNMRDPVLFGAAVDRLIADGHTIFLEIGAHPVLAPSIRDCSLERGVLGDVVACLRRGEPEPLQISRAIARLYTAGCSVDWHRIYDGPFRFVPLPTYPWQRERYWSETEESVVDRLGRREHPLLGERVSVALPTWQSDLNLNYTPYLSDHVIDDVVLFPAAASVEAWIAIHSAIEGRKTAVVEELAFQQALVVDSAQQTQLQWSYDGKTREYRMYSRTREGASEWNLHATARLVTSETWTGGQVDLDSLKGRFTDRIDVTDLYARLKRCGLEYGPSFRCVRKLWRRPRELLALVELEPQTAEDFLAYNIHPAILDAGFHSLIAALDLEKDAETDHLLYVPTSIRQVRYHARPVAVAWCHGTLVQRMADIIEGNVSLYDEEGKIVIEVIGLRCSAVKAASTDTDRLNEQIYRYIWEKAAPVTAFADPARWIFFTDGKVIGTSTADYLRSRGAAEVVEVVAGPAYQCLSPTRYQIRRHERSDLERLFRQVGIDNCRGVAYLWALQAYEEEDPVGTLGVVEGVRLVQTLTAAASTATPRLYVVTRNAQQVLAEESIAALSQASLVGLCRVAACEHPDLRCTLIDLGASVDARVGRRLGAELLAGSSEDDVALRGTQRYVHRLTRFSVQEPQQPVATPRSCDEGEIGFKLAIGVPGAMDTLRFQEIERRQPAAGEVEVRIRAAGLNFKDVIKVLGLLPQKAVENTFHGSNLGMEAAAVVTKVGENVRDYQIGDSILASLPHSFSSHVTIATDSLLAIKHMDALQPADATGIPVAFMTAYYALHKLARLRAGETVLIHTATGGVGLAAIQVAQWLGAQIFATAGSDAKRNYLRQQGIGHIWDSRTLAFADGVKEATGGKGVDVVLNSLSGEAFLKSLSVLAPLGRFVEIGKRDIAENSLLPMLRFNGNVTFMTVDLDCMMIERPDLIRHLLGEVWDGLQRRLFRPLPVKVFPAAQAAEAFRYMAQSKQIGKVVIDMENTDGLAPLPMTRRTNLIKDDATYMVTGGFGGAGLCLCRALARRGARHLAIVGRRGAATSEARQFLAELADQGIETRVLNADVSQEPHVTRILADIAASMPPLRGIFHAAGTVKDALLTNLDADGINAVMMPKALGAWHLHARTQSLPLDLFVLFSSAATLIGNPGQGNYVAANAFLDALAHHRRTQGLPALSINWGPLAGAGIMADHRHAAEQLARLGIRELSMTSAIETIFRLLETNVTQIAVMALDWPTLAAALPFIGRCPRFSALIAAADALEDGSPVGAVRSTLAKLEPKQRSEWLAGRLAELVAGALHLPQDRIDVFQPLAQLGIDSLVGVELQTAIGTKLGIRISALQLIKGETIMGLAAQLLQKNFPDFNAASEEGRFPPAAA